MDLTYIKKIGSYVLVTLLALALIASLVYHSFRKLTSDLELTFLTLETHLNTVEMSAFMLTSEKALEYPQYTNGMVIDHPMGDRSLVSVGDTVAGVYSDSVDKSLVVRLDDARRRLEFYEAVALCVARQSVDSISEKIRKCEKSISETDDLGRLAELRSELKVLLSAHSAKMDASVGYTELIKECQSEISSLNAELGIAKKEFTSDLNGGYFSSCDGYEGIVSSDELESADFSLLRDLVNGKLEPKSTDKSIGKLVDMNTWKLVCLTDKQSSLRLFDGTKVNVTLGNSGSVYKLTVERVIAERNSDDAVIILSCGQMISCDDYAHFQNVFVELESKEGYKIPIDAVRYENGIAGVFVLRGSKVIYRRIEIVGGGDGYVIASANLKNDGSGISPLNRYDRVIVRGHDLYDGKVIV